MPDHGSATETWKPIVGCEGFYEVSDMGRVRSLDRMVRGRPGVTRRHVGRIRKPVFISGYPAYSLSVGGLSKTRFAHRLVLEAFVGPCPDGMEACHHNDVKADPRLANLRWDTRKSNAADMVRNGRAAAGQRNGASKLTEDDVREIRRLRSSGVKQRDVARLFGVSQGTVSFIALRQTWRHVD